ncbi:AEC family transporter [Alteromonas sediminis]|uniref:AEC family transporter n=1 Tax=Alteromonas sediminis TaxID=2259342 RepID=A0A3N5XZL9_9ALTE|nr:AEC family transporter [Alteromonas sediminis]RPJ65993.1 AEC family transporter [Alteromonas sediminis]
MSSVHTAFTVVAPVILLICLGKLLAKLNVIQPDFVTAANKLAYQVTLPGLLFTAISQADMFSLFDSKMMLAGLLGSLLSFLLLLIGTGWMKVPHLQRGVVVQAGFRANMGIVGLAICKGLLGSSGLALASVYLGFIVPLFNFLAVWVLLLFSTTYISQGKILQEVFKSPLVIAVCLALPVSLLAIPIPTVLLKTGELIGQVTLPLALLCIGATIKFGDMRKRVRLLTVITLAKCFAYPAIVLFFGLMFALEDNALVVLLLLSVAPTATASFPATQQLGGDKVLAADAIALTTVLCLPLYMLIIAFL